MNPKDRRYTPEHEWVRLETGNAGSIGITGYAQSQLGDLVYLDLPKPGARVKQSQKIGEIESVKAVSELFTPVTGQVLEVNQRAVNEPQLVNQDPYGEGWLVRLELSNPAELHALMSSDAYDKLEASLSPDAAH